jgi:PmbA protein
MKQPCPYQGGTQGGQPTTQPTTNNQQPTTNMIQVRELANYAGDIARSLGIKKYDIYGSSIDSTNVQVDRGDPKQVKASNRSSVIVRVWNENDTVGVTSTTDVDRNGITLALKTACEASLFGVKENIPDFSPEATNPLPEVKVRQGQSSCLFPN